VRKFARLSEEEMLDRGKRYGMGLQLINILRDAGATFARADVTSE